MIFNNHLRCLNEGIDYNQVKTVMSIIYAVIAKAQSDIINLCSYDMAHGNYPTITHQILKNAKIPQSITYKYDNEYNFHILKDRGLIFVCMAGSRFKLKSAFAFLEEVNKQFRAKYSEEEIQRARDYDMSASFSEIFKAQVNFFNSNQAHDKKDFLMKQLSQLQEVMSENIDKVLQNEEKVELIVKKTAKLDSIADQIKKNASRMKKEAFWKRNKCKLAIGGLIVAIAVSFIIIL